MDWMAENVNVDNTTAKQTRVALFSTLQMEHLDVAEMLKVLGGRRKKELKANMMFAAFVAEEAVRRRQRWTGPGGRWKL